MALCDFLIIAGGGSGGSGAGGGGGAGGRIYTTGDTITAGTYAVVVGAGAALVNGADLRGNDGSASSFKGNTATGGGGGGSFGGTNATGKNGGCGGGGGWGTGSTPTGGTGSQGNNGGNGIASNSSAAGGGGGHGAVGSNGVTTTGGAGGAGSSNSITGSAVTRGGGGGSSGWTANGAGGSGGGGAGAFSNATAGTANTGGGGGGARDALTNSGAGGSGVVIIRLQTSDWSSITGGTQTTDGAFTVCTFNASADLILVAATGIGRDNSAKYTANTGSASFAVAAESNRLLVVAFYGNSTNTISNVQYAGVSMTSLYSATLGSGNNVYIFYLLAPTTGTNNITFTTSSSSCEVVAVSYYNVSQSGFPDANTTIAPASRSGTLTATLTTIANNAWQIFGYFSADPTGVTASTGSTLIQNQSSANAIFDSNGPLTPAGSKSMSVTLTGTQRSSGFSFSIAPVAAGGANGNFLRFM